MEIQASDQVVDWLENQTIETRRRVDAVLVLLSQDGPSLSRPLADSVSGSRIKNLKELRIGSSRKLAIRILYAFTENRTALLLVAGNKSSDWLGWYSQAIKMAEENYERYLEN